MVAHGESRLWGGGHKWLKGESATGQNGADPDSGVYLRVGTAGQSFGLDRLQGRGWSSE